MKPVLTPIGNHPYKHFQLFFASLVYDIIEKVEDKYTVYCLYYNGGHFKSHDTKDCCVIEVAEKDLTMFYLKYGDSMEPQSNYLTISTTNSGRNLTLTAGSYTYFLEAQ